MRGMSLWSRYTCGAARRVETRLKCPNWRDLLTASWLNLVGSALHADMASKPFDVKGLFAFFKLCGNLKVFIHSY